MQENFQIKSEVLRYLGYKDQKIDDNMNELIENSIKDIKTLSRGKYIYKFFDIIKKEELILNGYNLRLSGDDIKKHLKKADKCILLAVSLGHRVDTKIRYYEKIDMARALILDACASAYIEEICDKVCKDIEGKLSNNKVLTSRYSPGYGDLPIEIQNEFLLTLGAKKTIGLNVSDSNILIPRKSVTAIMGIVDKNDRKLENSCLKCNKYPTCKFSKGGSGCGY